MLLVAGSVVASLAIPVAPASATSCTAPDPVLEAGCTAYYVATWASCVNPKLVGCIQ